MQIIKEVKMSLSDVSFNNNKYWSGKITDSNSVILEWGRIGDTLQTKTKSFNSPDSAESFLNTKIREKEKKGYTHLNIVSGTTVTINTDKQSLKEVAKSQIVSDDETIKLIERLTEENVHNILTATTMTFSKDTGLFATPLGIVNTTAINSARDLLNQMASYVQKQDFENKDYINLLNSYLRFIPQKVGRKLKADIYPDLDSIKAQNDIIDSLEVSYQQSIISDPSTPAKTEVSKVFSCEIKSVTDLSIIDYIDKKYKSTLQSIHSSSNLKVKKVYSVKIDKMHDIFKEKGEKLGEIWELWHGTKTAHLLSILKNGLIIPPANNPHVCGRMYGSGIYFSDQSTKALNYANGYWGGNRQNNCYMLLCDVAMGKYYTPKSYSETLPKPGYDSTFAKSGYSGVMNNEMIVPNVYQANLKYLVEFDR